MDAAAIDAIRERVRALMKTEGLSQADVARSSGIPNGTFTQWLPGTYAGNNEKLAKRVEQWLEAREAEKAFAANQALDPGFVRTETAEKVLHLLNWARTQPGITLITLGPGMGKTTTCRHYAENTPHAYRVVMRPTTSSAHSMVAEIALTLGVTERHPARVSRAIGEKLQRNGRRTLIMIDEAQHLSDAAVNELRTFHDENGAGIALIGNEDVTKRWGSRAPTDGYGQLHRRIGPRLRQLKPTRGDITAYLDACGIEDEAVRRLLHVIGGKPGAIGQVAETLSFASLLAAAAGGPITAKEIKEAWENRSGEGLS